MPGSYPSGDPRQVKEECYLPEQALFNSNCNLKPAQIPDVIDLVPHDLKYEDVVNMKDVTGLDCVDFSDALDMGQPGSYPLGGSMKGKTVNFLDKFGDSGPVEEIDTWDASVPEKKYLRTRN